MHLYGRRYRDTAPSGLQHQINTQVSKFPLWVTCKWSASCSLSWILKVTGFGEASSRLRNKRGRETRCSQWEEDTQSRWPTGRHLLPQSLDTGHRDRVGGRDGGDWIEASTRHHHTQQGLFLPSIMSSQEWSVAKTCLAQMRHKIRAPINALICKWIRGGHRHLTSTKENSRIRLVTRCWCWLVFCKNSTDTITSACYSNHRFIFEEKCSVTDKVKASLRKYFILMERFSSQTRSDFVKWETSDKFALF